MVYPALTYLEEIGHATVEVEGSRKLYHITDAGKEHLDDNRSTADALFAQFNRVGERMDRVRRAMRADEAGEGSDAEHERRGSKELLRARRDLKSALADKWDSSREEQQRVIEELETKDTVMVQGPPGTGKTHTIANLIGHLLAKHQRILVTSHASKALRVVKELLAPSLRPLCVSVLHGDDDSSKELDESISGIINYLAKSSAPKLEEEIRQLTVERTELVKESDKLRQDLREAALMEYRRVDFQGQKNLPAALGRRIASEREQHGWIPGPTAEADKCPLTEEDIKKLYRINSQLTDEDNALLAGPLPSLDQLPSAKEFISYFDQFKSLDKKIPEEIKEFWEPASVGVVALERLKHHLADAIEGVNEYIASVETSDADYYQTYSQAMQLRQEVVMVHGVKMPAGFQLFEIVQTSNTRGLRFRSAQRRQEQRGEGGDDGNHHEQLDQGEGV